MFDMAAGSGLKLSKEVLHLSLNRVLTMGEREISRDREVYFTVALQWAPNVLT